MLTKQDLQQIRSVVREEVTLQVDSLKQDVGSLKQDVGVLKQDSSSLKEDMKFVKKSLRGLKMKTTRIHNTLSVAIKTFDATQVNHAKRLKKIENHLGFAA